MPGQWYFPAFPASEPADDGSTGCQQPSFRFKVKDSQSHYGICILFDL